MDKGLVERPKLIGAPDETTRPRCCQGHGPSVPLAAWL
jgi:hypothetical protein